MARSMAGHISALNVKASAPGLCVRLRGRLFNQGEQCDGTRALIRHVLDVFVDRNVKHLSNCFDHNWVLGSEKLGG